VCIKVLEGLQSRIKKANAFGGDKTLAALLDGGVKPPATHTLLLMVRCAAPVIG
jgi:hypothetical protein